MLNVHFMVSVTALKIPPKSTTRQSQSLNFPSSEIHFCQNCGAHLIQSEGCFCEKIWKPELSIAFITRQSNSGLSEIRACISLLRTSHTHSYEL